MSLTPIFHPEEDWLKAMVDKDQGSLVPRNREEEWYSEIINSMQSGGSSGGGSSSLVLSESTTKPSTRGLLKGGAEPDDPEEPSVTTYYLDHTWEEIRNALLTGSVVFTTNNYPYSVFFVTGCNYNTSRRKYVINVYDGNVSVEWFALSTSDYPSRDM